MPLTWGNVELRGVEPLASCMPCNKSNAPAWAFIAPTWIYRALECLWVPASLCALAVHLAVRWSLITSAGASAGVAQPFQNDPTYGPPATTRPAALQHRAQP
jgi:hypothetical protein